MKEAEKRGDHRKSRKRRRKSFHLSRVLPGGKALETEGLREASSVGRGVKDQEVGVKVRVRRLVERPIK